MNKRKIGTRVIAVMLVAVVGVCIGRNCWKNRKVEFADENMAKVICGSIYGYGGNVTPENVTWEQLDSIESLDIGYTGYYNTIKDIAKCRNLKKLYVNNVLMEYSAVYQIANGNIEKNLSVDDIEKLQEELAKELPKLKKIEQIEIADLGNCKWTSIEFLKYCNKLKSIEIWGSSADDYSALKECKALESVALWKCNVSSADDLMGLESLKYITLSNTPLDQNPEELQKLKAAYPDVEFDIKKPSKGE